MVSRQRTTITTKTTLKDRLDIYSYEKQLTRLWNQTKRELPEYVRLYEKYDDLLVTQAQSKAARINNLRALISLGRIVKSKNYSWDGITREQINSILSYIMRTWADAEGKETWHTAGQKKFLMQFVRWLKTGNRLHNKRTQEPEEIIDITIKHVKQKLTREDLLTPQELDELLEACGENLRDKAIIAFGDDAGPRAGENLNNRIGHVKFLDNGGAVIYVDGKTDDRPIHVLKCVPHLAAWINAHPFKEDKTAPLWIDLSRAGYGKHLTYAGCRTMLLRRVELAIKNAELKGRKSTLSSKRVFMTLLRHGEITRSAKWMAPQLIKKRHGWKPGTRMFENYEHLVQQDVGDAVFAHYGLVNNKTDDEPMPKFCNICKKLNTPESTMCVNCGKALDLKTAIENDERKEEEIKKIANEAFLENMQQLRQKTVTEIENQRVSKQNEDLQRQLDILKAEMAKLAKQSQSKI